jgi:hypothetical protein
MSATVTSNKSSKRVSYGFKLDFPTTDFTLRDLRKAKSHKVKYITLYMRVKNALKKGDLVEVGEKAPAKARRGRKELIFRRADAKQTAITVKTGAVAPVEVAA